MPAETFNWMSWLYTLIKIHKVYLVSLPQACEVYFMNFYKGR